MKKIEEWRKYLNTEYEVSSTGRVRKGERLISQTINSTGYYTCGIKVKVGKFKTMSCHRMEAIAFIPNPENKPHVNHKDGNKLNNELSNLEWATQSENSLHAFSIGLRSNYKRSQLHRDQISRKNSKPIRVTDLTNGNSAIYESCPEFSRQSGISLSSILQAKCRGNLIGKQFKIEAIDAATLNLESKEN